MAAASIVVDASVLIALGQLEQLALLESLFGNVFIPPAVAREVGPSIPILPAWVEVRIPTRGPDERILAASLGPGETEVLCLALETPEAWVILDDLDARHLARALGLEVLGTAAVLVEAKRAALIAEIRPLLQRLVGKGFRLSPEVYDTILVLAGETEPR
jgi:uncharacterized protein